MLKRCAARRDQRGGDGRRRLLDAGRRRRSGRGWAGARRRASRREQHDGNDQHEQSRSDHGRTDYDSSSMFERQSHRAPSRPAIVGRFLCKRTAKIERPGVAEDSFCPHRRRPLYSRMRFEAAPSRRRASRGSGELAEWLKAHDWKSCMRRQTVSRVRIPSSPPSETTRRPFLGPPYCLAARRSSWGRLIVFSDSLASPSPTAG